MKNTKLPPNYVSEIANRFSELETRLVSAYTPVYQNFNVSQQLAEHMQSISAMYQQNINRILDIDKITAPLYELSNTINTYMSAYLKRFDFSEIANRYTDLLAPDFSSILNTYSQIDFSHLFNNLTVTDEYVEMDDESFEAVSNTINSLPDEVRVTIIQEPDKFTKRMDIAKFIVEIISILLTALTLIQGMSDNQNQYKELEETITTFISSLPQSSVQEHSTSHPKVSESQEYSQEHPCTTSEFDEDADTRKKQEQLK